LFGIELKSLSLDKNSMTTFLLLTACLLACSSPVGISSTHRVEPQLRGQLAQKSEPQTRASAKSIPEEDMLRLLEQQRRHEEEMAPSKPQEVKVQRVGINSVSITWKPPRVPFIQGKPIVEYWVNREEENNTFTREVLVKTRGFFFQDNTAVRGKSYVYTVISVTGHGQAAPETAAPIQIP
jgi:hypothetical protein